ncbi:putative mitochondrial carrier protein pet8 protein [Daldinia childiae]|uniref:putative mitochondrial carrier protein pet8 protein n=1 Tax=Daldinia childiae TaxID=326645 RepID=UPI001446F616|nr:putative mitochondrial carrier protein pet8 protein [Daldinia childiae]KAF3071001.1 putative mitochondrial carrier protein pet8 protein [Daldinia childiae]
MASRMLFRSAATIATGRQAVAQRTFTTSSVNLSYKESSHGSETHDPEKHKQDLLAKHKEGKGHWKPELASDSEEAVKADRHGGGGKEDIAALQERTKSAAEETSKAGTSMRDGLLDLMDRDGAGPTK